MSIKDQIEKYLVSVNLTSEGKNTSDCEDYEEHTYVCGELSLPNKIENINSKEYINNLIQSNSKDELIKFISSLTKAIDAKFNVCVGTLVATTNSLVDTSQHINPVTGSLYTHTDKQAMKISKDDAEYKPNWALTNAFGMDYSTKEHSETILTQEDADLMNKARLAVKRQAYQRIAVEEFKRGALPISLKQRELVESIKIVMDSEANQAQNKIDTKYAVVCDIPSSECIPSDRMKKLISKTWIKPQYHLTEGEKTENKNSNNITGGYRLIVMYSYPMDDGRVGKRTMSMMKKEIASTLKCINKDDIVCKVINKSEYINLTCLEVD